MKNVNFIIENSLRNMPKRISAPNTPAKKHLNHLLERPRLERFSVQ